MGKFWLNPIPEVLHHEAAIAIESGDVIGFLIKAGNEYGLELVIRNLEYLIARGLYEKALFEAWVSTRTNLAMYSTEALRFLFGIADRRKLFEAGDPPPDQEFLVGYRGVSGRGRARRVRGFSWSGSLERARWFANRFGHLGDPAVYSVQFTRDAILAYMNDRQEDEFILLPDSLTPKRLREAAANRDMTEFATT